ncbi:MAG: hypothetical protein OEV30_11475 [Ignavibacteria bacterium]|nr:hypothetical protein [Ignavibacteria bacterium]
MSISSCIIVVLLCACSSIGGGVDRDIAIQYLAEEKLTKDLTTFTYRLSVDQTEPGEMKIWVKESGNVV